MHNRKLLPVPRYTQLLTRIKTSCYKEIYLLINTNCFDRYYCILSGINFESFREKKHTRELGSSADYWTKMVATCEVIRDSAISVRGEWDVTEVM